MWYKTTSPQVSVVDLILQPTLGFLRLQWTPTKIYGCKEIKKWNHICTQVFWRNIALLMIIIRNITIEKTLLVRFLDSATGVSLENFQKLLKKISKSYFGIAAFVFRLLSNIYERYSISVRIQSECSKIQTRKNSGFGHFSRSDIYGISNLRHPTITPGKLQKYDFGCSIYSSKLIKYENIETCPCIPFWWSSG